MAQRTDLTHVYVALLRVAPHLLLLASLPLSCARRPVLPPEGVSRSNPQLAHRGVDVRISIDGESTLDVPRTPLCITGLPVNDRQAPRLGQHNNALLKAKL